MGGMSVPSFGMPEYSFLMRVFQVLLLDGENTGKETGSIRDARGLVIADKQFWAFLHKHKSRNALSQKAMKT